MLDIVKAVFASVIFQILFLIQNAVRFTLQLIISGKPFVQCRDFSLVGFCHSFTFFVFLVGGTICNKDTIFLSSCKRIFALSLFIIALGIGDYIGTVHLHEGGFDEKTGLAAATAADDQDVLFRAYLGFFGRLDMVSFSVWVKGMFQSGTGST